MPSAQSARTARVRSLLKGTGEGCLVKLCGMTRPEDMEAVNLAMPDLCGFVVGVASSRRSIGTDELRRLSTLLDPAVASVGVFVNADVDTIAPLVRDGIVDAVQLHGAEDAAYVASLRAACDVPIIQAFVVRDMADVERANASAADMVLLDAGAGGGITFSWDLTSAANRPFLLAGGLTPANVAAAIAATHPLGVDMSSGVETGGAKDADKMRQAVRAARAFGRDGEPGVATRVTTATGTPRQARRTPWSWYRQDE